MKAKNTVSPRRISMMVLLFCILAFFIIWAALFKIDQSVRAPAAVIAISRTQVIQAVDGGVLAELRVQEGQRVIVGQVLAVLEKSRAQAGYEENRSRAASMRIALIRAKAESILKTPKYGNDFSGYEKFILAQTNLFLQRKRALEEELVSGEKAMDMAAEELRMNEVLLKDGDVSRLEMLKARRQVTDLEGRIAAVRNKYRQDASSEVAKIEEELSSLNSKLAERQDILDHTDLMAPVAGVIKFLKVTTIGGVLRAGDELMQIAPSENALILEAKINPADIGLLRTGLPVTVKADAFDYSVYGTLAGELIYVSPDTLSEQAANGQATSYYRAHIKLNIKQSHNSMANQIVIRPGMTASVDIRTGTRSVLNYLIKPISRAFGGALNER